MYTKQPNQNGYILVLTLMLISIMAIMVTQLFHKAVVQTNFDRIMIDREKAKALALGGIEIAMGQLTIAVDQKEKKEMQKDDAQKKLLKAIVPILNRWQEFPLKEKNDGIDGTVKIAICCEQGKLDINEFFDFEAKKFKNEGQATNDAKKVCQEIFNSLKKFIGGTDLFSVFEKFLKGRQYKLNDVTELMEIPEFQRVFKLMNFYEPPTQETKRKRPVYLTDLFTVWSNHDKLQPWLLSDSICGIFNFKRAEFNDVGKRKRQIDQIIKDFKGFNEAVVQVWDKQLKPFYGRDFKELSKIVQELLAGQFEPTVFSVLSYGQIGEITQKIFAIIEKRSASQNASGKLVIKKLYWL
jgi:hypothetical protein